MPVEGSVTGAPHPCAVHLQRLYGATAWRTLGTANTRTSGRFTLTAQPAAKGSASYRVSFPLCGWFAATVGKTFTISGT